VGNEDNIITLPEITIVGHTDSRPTNASEWWGEGYVTGYNDPDTDPDRPMLLNDEMTAVFLAGVIAGREARQQMEAEWEARFRNVPQLGPDPGGEPFEEVERRYREAWEAVFHQHPPHTEVEVEPGAPPPMPNIGFVPPALRVP
jgi:hypothetical protein